MLYYCGLCASVSAFCSGAICVWFRRSARSGGIWCALVQSVARLVCSSVYFFCCAFAAGLVAAADLLPLSAACPVLPVLAHGVQVCRCRAICCRHSFPVQGLAAHVSSRAEQYIILLYIHIYSNSYELYNHMSDGLYDSFVHMMVVTYESNLMHIE